MTLPVNLPMIMVIDADGETVFEIAERLEGCGATLRSCNNVVSARHCLNSMTPLPSIIIMEWGIWLFPSNGPEFLAELRQNPYLADVPVLIHTDYDVDQKDIDGAGNVSVLAKGSDAELFRETVLNLLRK